MERDILSSNHRWNSFEGLVKVVATYGQDAITHANSQILKSVHNFPDLLSTNSLEGYHSGFHEWN